ncbi:hypothetical protein [Modestobacter sp. KNN46-3]|jgi:hypothetical protein|uniref:hypothetical protein n=1 Tax=Modestobacter sp. KNN46-3 TaxID=2711218 RepID=UPI0013DFF191|nr:hypothetical protein [Modestobacter sp. KNN46-3]
MAEARAAVGRGSLPDPTRRALKALITAYHSGDDWDDLFGRLTLSELNGLRALVPHMPPRAARHFAENVFGPH